VALTRGRRLTGKKKTSAAAEFGTPVLGHTEEGTDGSPLGGGVFLGIWFLGSVLIIEDLKRRVIIWNSESGEIGKVLENEEKGQAPLTLGFSPGGRFLGACCGRRDSVGARTVEILKLWDLKQGKAMTVPCTPDVLCFCFSRDDSKVASVRRKVGLVTLLELK